MNNANILDEMDLPLCNPKEELETISRNNFKPLFDITQFEIRSEDYRDKGIDFQIEIKKSGKYTNFRFAVQLKATDSEVVNSDGSISIQIYTSNINYLLNFGMPSFYVLYFSKLKTFFYENINDFIRTLADDKISWQDQNSHVLRFRKKLSVEGIKDMYESTLEKGLFQREINVRLAIHSSSLKRGDKIVIDQNLSITDDKEIRELIENIGLELINEARWNEVLLVHKRASGNVASTPMYNLVIGIANYYNSRLVESLSFLNAASKKIDDLPDSLKKHLAYFLATVKFSLGLITRIKFDQLLTELEDDKVLGLYIKLENAKQKYIESLDKSTIDGYEKFVDEVTNLINDSSSVSSFKLYAKCELLLHEGSKNNMDYVKEIAIINAIEEKIGPDLQSRLGFAKGFIKNNQEWVDKANMLKKEALEDKNYLAFHNVLMNEIRVTYEFYAYASIIKIEQDLPGYPKQEYPNIEPLFNELLVKIDKAEKYYVNIGHIENILVTLSLKFEILHFLSHNDDAIKVLNEIEFYVNAYDLENQKEKLDFLKVEGPTHTRFKKWVEEAHQKAKSDKLEFDTMIKEMKKMDEAEKSNKTSSITIYIIQLFPIGYFQFPTSDEKTVYKILNIKSNILRNLLNKMFNEDIVPIINIYYDKIIEEGYRNGNLADQGIGNWRNIYRIRKAFFNHGYIRTQVNL